MFCQDCNPESGHENKQKENLCKRRKFSFRVEQAIIFKEASGGIMRRYHLGKLWI
jgi:hypothetical protein